MVGVKECFVDLEVVKVCIFGRVEIEPLARFLGLPLPSVRGEAGCHEFAFVRKVS